MPSTHIDIVEFDDLGTDDRAVWSELCAAGTICRNPFFSIEFAAAVNRVCSDVEVAVFRRGGAAVGLLPFQSNDASVATPVGGSVAPIQGPVAEPGISLDLREFVRAAHLRSFDYDALVAAAGSPENHFRLRNLPILELASENPSADLPGMTIGSSWIPQTQWNIRELIRLFGPLRFVLGENDPRVLERLLNWKSEPAGGAGGFRIPSGSWLGRLVKQLSEPKGGELQGIVSSLCAGDSLRGMQYNPRYSFEYLRSRRCDDGNGWSFPARRT